MKRNPAHSSISGGLIRGVSNLLPKLLVVNLLTFIFCIPLVTAGASLCAMHDCLLKILRETDDRLGRQFLQSFRQNWKQATLLWLPFLMIFAAALVDILVVLIAPDVLAEWVVVPAISAAIAALLLFQFVMPMQAHFENTALNILRSAAILSVSHLPKTVLMAALGVLPVFLFLKVTLSWPLLFLFGLSLPGYFCAKLYNPVFLELEES